MSRTGTPRPGLRWIAIALTIVASAPTLAQPDEPSVFTASRNNLSGDLSSFRMLHDGTLVLVGVYPATDVSSEALALSPDGGLLAQTHATASGFETLALHRVAADGSLTLLSTTTVDDAPFDVVWLGVDRLAVTETTLLGGSFVHTYRVDRETGLATEIDVEPTGLFSGYLAVHPHGRWLYATDSFGFSLYTFEVLPDGRLEVVDVLDTTPIYALDPVLSRDGTQLFAAGGVSDGGDRLLAFTVDPFTGRPRPIDGSPFVSSGVSPAFLAIDESAGPWLLVGHGTDATVRTFSIAPDAGLAETGAVFDVGNQGTLGDVRSLRGYAIATDNTDIFDDLIGVYPLEIDSDGEMTPVAGAPFDAGTREPDPIAVWDPDRSLWLEVPALVAGTEVTLEVTGGRPQERTGLVFGTRGPGATEVPRAGVTVELAEARAAAPFVETDAVGTARFTVAVTAGSEGGAIWFQALQSGRVSNVVGRAVDAP